MHRKYAIKLNCKVSETEFLGGAEYCPFLLQCQSEESISPLLAKTRECVVWGKAKRNFNYLRDPRRPLGLEIKYLIWGFFQ